MHITLETDYAVRIVNTLARIKLENTDGNRLRPRLDAGSIADETEVPLRFALKILRKLTGGGIVRSYKGVYGGYELAKELPELSLYDVVELVEGTYRFSRCLDEKYNCTCAAAKKGLPCAYQHAFGEVSDMVCDFLKTQTFDKLVR